MTGKRNKRSSLSSTKSISSNLSSIAEMSPEKAVATSPPQTKYLGKSATMPKLSSLATGSPATSNHNPSCAPSQPRLVLGDFSRPTKVSEMKQSKHDAALLKSSVTVQNSPLTVSGINSSTSVMSNTGLQASLSSKSSLTSTHKLKPAKPSISWVPAPRAVPRIPRTPRIPHTPRPPRQLITPKVAHSGLTGSLSENDINKSRALPKQRNRRSMIETADMRRYSGNDRGGRGGTFVTGKGTGPRTPSQAQGQLGRSTRGGSSASNGTPKSNESSSDSPATSTRGRSRSYQVHSGKGVRFSTGTSTPSNSSPLVQDTRTRLQMFSARPHSNVSEAAQKSLSPQSKRKASEFLDHPQNTPLRLLGQISPTTEQKAAPSLPRARTFVGNLTSAFSRSLSRQSSGKSAEENIPWDAIVKAPTPEEANRYWTGRFVSKKTKFQNEGLAENLTRVDLLQRSGRIIDPDDEYEKLLTDQDLMTLRIFKALEELSVTKEAKKGLWEWQLLYARNQKNEKYLPEGGTMVNSRGTWVGRLGKAIKQEGKELSKKTSMAFRTRTGEGFGP
ncbi:hypothetical protein BJ878DRAFT_43239 [Calycina marina]|uniref:Uncharacterized protein n=1 Tax=Calycina marina TaxID=1763456 RepID=A0A9P7Z4T3_9HELO|nr:hypothetical protein BJ878DRAFT_43239 [Calycina marina]